MSTPGPDAMFWLRHNPDILTRINEVRAENGLPPIDPSASTPEGSDDDG